MNSFQENLVYGKVAEEDVTLWLKYEKKYCVLPVYDIVTNTTKGPRLLTLPKDLIVPDLLAMKEDKIRWIESKRKTHFAWHRNSGGNWRTGIDLRNYLDYIKVEEQTGINVWLFFLHEEETPSTSDLSWGCPPTCPVGLFGAPLWHLKECEAERGKFSNGWRNYPMVYWNVDALRLFASLEQMHTYRTQRTQIHEEELIF